jgi:hypothetical protein
MRTYFGIAALGGAAMALLAGSAAADDVGTVTVCYYSHECTYIKPLKLTPPLDAPAFQFTNTGSEDITDAEFKVLADPKSGIEKEDSYFIGTIKAGKSVVVVPQFSNDHKKHATGAFFAYSGSALDTSDAGLDASSVKFAFTGKTAAGTVSSGTIVTGATAGQSKDGTVKNINFLGGPNNADGPCDDCFAPKEIATLTVGSTQ